MPNTPFCLLQPLLIVPGLGAEERSLERKLLSLRCDPEQYSTLLWLLVTCNRSCVRQELACYSLLQRKPRTGWEVPTAEHISAYRMSCQSHATDRRSRQRPFVVCDPDSERQTSIGVAGCGGRLPHGTGAQLLAWRLASPHTCLGTFMRLT